MQWRSRGKWLFSCSKMWLSNPHFLARLNAGNLLPATIHKQADYLFNLQEKSLLIQMGEYSKLEDKMDRRQIIVFKNKFLAPIFQELKAAIRLMTYTEEYKILKSFQDLKNVIKAKHSGNTAESKRVLFQLYLRHSQLLAKLHSEQNNPEIKLQVLEEQVDNIRAVLALWEYYTYIIYLPDTQVYAIMQLEAKSELKETEQELSKIKERMEEAKLGEEGVDYQSVLEDETSDTSEAEEELSQKYDIMREDMLGEADDNNEMAAFSDKELVEKIQEKSQKTSAGFQFKGKHAEFGFLSQKSVQTMAEAHNFDKLDTQRKSQIWSLVQKTVQNEKQAERFNRDEATVLSGTAQNFLDRNVIYDRNVFLKEESMKFKQEELFEKYEKEFLESQSGSLYGEAEDTKKVDQMVQDMDFEKLGLKQFMEAQSLDKLYEEHPHFDAYDRMRLHDTARRMVEEMNLMKETLSQNRIPDSTKELQLRMDDEKRGASETAHLSLVVQHYIKQLNNVKDGRLEPKYLAKKRSLLKKLEAMKEIEILDPKILLQIQQRVGYKLPEFDLE